MKASFCQKRAAGLFVKRRRIFRARWLNWRALEKGAVSLAGRSYAKTKLDWSVLVPIYKEILMG